MSCLNLTDDAQKMVTKVNRKSLRAEEISGHHNVPGRNQEVSRAVRSARLCVACQHPFEHTSNSDPNDYSNISPTNYLLTIMQKAVSGLPTKFPATPPTFHVRTNCTTANFLGSQFAVAAPNWRASSLRSSNCPPIPYHELLLASNTVPQTRSP